MTKRRKSLTKQIGITSTSITAFVIYVIINELPVDLYR